MKRLLCLLAMTAAITWGDPVYVITHIDVTPNFTAQTVALLKQLAADSKKDPGFVRFEAIQQEGRGNHLAVFEVWQSKEAFENHNSAPHSKAFREKLQPMLGSPFDVRLHAILQ